MSDITNHAYRYWAFISYSSNDATHAKWLHRAIETYGIPAKLVEHGHTTPMGEPAPNRFHPIFRDRDELPASADLGEAIEDALAASRYLIVICSPNGAQSKWVNREIETFSGLGRSDRVFAFIVDGEPNSGDEQECFPPALKEQEPLAADARRQGDGRDNAKLKLLAGMLGVSFDALKQREAQRRIRRLQLAIAASLILVLTFGGLAWYANRARGRALVAEGNAIAEANVRATAEANAVDEAHARATAQAVAEDRQREAERQSQISLVRQLAAQSAAETNRETRLLVAATAAKMALESQMVGVTEVDSALRAALEAAPVKFIRHGAGDADQAMFNADGSCLATTGYDRQVRLWDTATGVELAAAYRGQRTYTPGQRMPAYGVFNADGSRFLIRTADGIVHLLNAATGVELAALPGEAPGTAPDGSAPEYGSFSPEGSRAVMVTRDAVLHLLDAVTGAEVLRLRLSSGSADRAFDQAGERLAVADVTTLYLIDPQDGRLVSRLPHTERIAVMVFDASGRRLLSLAPRAGSQLIDTDTGKVLASWSWAVQPVWGAFSSKNNWILSRDSAGVLHFMGAGDGTELQVIQTQTGGGCWAFSTDERYLVVGDSKGNLQVVSRADSASFLLTFDSAVRKCAIAHDGERALIQTTDYSWHLVNLPSGHPQRIVAGSELNESQSVQYNEAMSRVAVPLRDGTVRLLDGTNLQEIAVIERPKEDLRSMQFAARGTRLILTYHPWAIALYDSATGAGPVPVTGLSGHRLWNLDAHQSRMLTAGPDGAAYVLDAGNGSVLLRLAGVGAVKQASFSPSGSRVVTQSEGMLELWDAETGRRLAQVSGWTGEFLSDPDGNERLWEITNYSWDRLYVNTTDGKVLRTLSPPPTGGMPLTQVDPSGRYAFSQGVAGEAAALWDLRRNERPSGITTSGRITGLAFSSGNAWIAVATTDDKLHIWSLSAADESAALSLPPGPWYVETDPNSTYRAGSVWGDLLPTAPRAGVEQAISPALDRPGTQAFAQSSGRWARIEDDGSATVLDGASGSPIHQLQHEPGFAITQLAFSPDGTRLTTAGSDHTARVWDMDTGRELASLSHQGPVQALAFNRDGRHLATTDGVARIWDMVNFTELRRLQSPNATTSLAVAPGGERLLTLDTAGVMTLWNFTSGQELLSMRQAEPIGAWSFNADGRFLATATVEQLKLGPTIRVWDLVTGAERARLSVGNPIRQLALSADGHLLAAASDNNVEIWKLWLDDLLSDACHVLSRNLTVAEWQRFAGDRAYEPTCPDLPRVDVFPDPVLQAPLTNTPPTARTVLTETRLAAVDPDLPALIYLGTDARLWLLNPARDAGVPLTDDSGIVAFALAPSSSRVAFMMQEKQAAAVSLRRFDADTVAVEATRLGEVLKLPRWSESGDMLDYDDLQQQHWTLDASGVNHPVGTGPVTKVSWSSDGRYVAYLADAILWAEQPGSYCWKVAENVETIMWSPTRPRLAFQTISSVADPQSAVDPDGRKTFIFDPRSGYNHLVAKRGYPVGWEPTGTELNILSAEMVGASGATYGSYLWNDEREELIAVTSFHTDARGSAVTLTDDLGRLRRLVDVGVPISWTADGRFALVLEGDWLSPPRRLYFFDSQTNDLKLLLEQEGMLEHALNPGVEGVLSRQGTWALVTTLARTEKQQLFLIRPETGEQRELPYLEETQFSSDEKWILGRSNARWLLIETATGRRQDIPSAEGQSPVWVSVQ